MVKRILAVLLPITIALPTIADAVNVPILMGNLDFLKDAPGTYFSKADMAIFRKTAETALNEAKDGETRNWSNADTGSSGEVKVVRTLPPSDTRCRELRVMNRAAGRTHTERGVFCYDGNKDRWTMRPGSQ
ncbi:MAG: RT0821/Lpp0805 family surface protein [Sulfurifustis sp.]